MPPLPVTGIETARLTSAMMRQSGGAVAAPSAGRGWTQIAGGAGALAAPRHLDRRRLVLEPARAHLDRHRGLRAPNHLRDDLLDLLRRGHQRAAHAVAQHPALGAAAVEVHDVEAHLAEPRGAFARLGRVRGEELPCDRMLVRLEVEDLERRRDAAQQVARLDDLRGHQRRPEPPADSPERPARVGRQRREEDAPGNLHRSDSHGHDE